jgi:hypothetical protein
MDNSLRFNPKHLRSFFDTVENESFYTSLYQAETKSYVNTSRTSSFGEPSMTCDASTCVMTWSIYDDLRVDCYYFDPGTKFFLQGLHLLSRQFPFR